MTDITARLLSQFPANVFGINGITVDKSGGAFTIGIDFDAYWSVDGSMLVRSGGVPTELLAGEVGFVLTANGVGKVPTYQAIGAAQIPPGSIGTDELADGAVTTIKISNLNVTLAKLAPDSVDASKIVDGEVGTLELGALVVTAPKLAANSVETAKILDANVTAAKIVNINPERLMGMPQGQPAGAFQELTITKVMDLTNGSVPAPHGALAYRNATDWVQIPPGVAQQILETQGPGANPRWVTAGTPAFPAGSVINTAYVSTSTYLTGTSVIPQDDTIPQISEGSLILTQAVTPVFANSKFRISGTLQGGKESNGWGTLAVFIDSGPDAINSVNIFLPAAFVQAFPYLVEFTPGSGAAFTVTVRFGAQSGNWSINGPTTGRTMGGSQTASLRIEEIVV